MNMNVKEEYNSPEIGVVEFDNEDVITTSNRETVGY